MSSNNATFNNLTANSSTDDSFLWDEGSGGISWNLLEMGVIMTRVMSGAIVSVSILFNCLVFSATSKACGKTLKSKHFILNSIIGDIALAAGSSTIVFLYILQAFQQNRVRDLVASFGHVVLSYTRLVQVFASVLLVVDRMYAVVKPMAYHTIGYSKLTKILLVASPWACAVALVLPTFIIPYIEDGLDRSPLHVQVNFGHKQFTLAVREHIIIGVNCLVFLLYAVVFVVFILERRRNPAVKGSTSEKATLSLTVTYFFTHTSSLCFYVPAPLFTLVRDSIPDSVMPRAVKFIVNRMLVHLFIFNTVVNAVLLGTRVRLIRQNLRSIFKRRNPKIGPGSKKNKVYEGRVIIL